MDALLTPRGYQVITANDGQEAVKAACEKKPDLILMDTMMPKMDGLTACHEIKINPSTHQIPIVMVTALDSDGNKLLAKRVWGVDGYVTKPVDLNELLGVIADF